MHTKQIMKNDLMLEKMKRKKLLTFSPLSDGK